MQVAIVSDIHGNRHAFQAVLDDIATTVAAELWCLGDLVGYGAEPDACVELARAARHDLPVRQPRPGRDGRAVARRVLARRGDRRPLDAGGHGRRDTSTGCAPLNPHERGPLRRPLPRQPPRSRLGVRALARCSPSCASTRRAIASASSAIRTSRSRSSAARASWPRASRAAAATARPRRGRVAAEPRSVGQPRDGDPRAAWMLLDLDARTAQWRRVDYDIGGAAGGDPRRAPA